MAVSQPKFKRIVHVIYSGLGGHGAMLFSLLGAGLFSSSSHHVVMAGEEPPLKNYTNQLDLMGLSWSYVKKRPGLDLDFYRRLSADFVKYKPDILFLNGLAALPAVFGFYLRVGRRRPLVLLRESQAGHLKTKQDWILLVLSHFIVDHIVHLTAEAANGAEMKLKRLYRNQKVTVIPNGLNTDFFKREPRRTEDTIIRIGMVSRLQANKDHITLIKAFEKVQKSCSDKTFKLYIAGEGTTRSQIEEEIATRRLRDSVVMCGMLDSSGVHDLMNELHLYVHASFGETMSNSIMQAMAMQLPIVASDVGGIKNMIGTQFGLLYPCRDVDMLAQQMLHIINNPNIADKYAARARHNAETAYDLQEIVEKYESLVNFD